MFAKRLSSLRKSKGITQAEFARIFDIATGTIGMWESGQREPNFEMMQKIADYFEVTVDYLLGRDEVPVALSRPDGYENLTEEERDHINSLIDIFLKNKDKQ